MARAIKSSYTSTPNGHGATSGIKATSAGAVPEKRRSTPDVGSYQSGNTNRGGPMTQNLDRAPDTDCTYEAPGLAALRKAQDARRPHGSEGR